MSPLTERGIGLKKKKTQQDRKMCTPPSGESSGSPTGGSSGTAVLSHCTRQYRNGSGRKGRGGSGWVLGPEGRGVSERTKNRKRKRFSMTTVTSTPGQPPHSRDECPLPTVSMEAKDLDKG